MTKSKKSIASSIIGDAPVDEKLANLFSNLPVERPTISDDLDQVEKAKLFASQLLKEKKGIIRFKRERLPEKPKDKVEEKSDEEMLDVESDSDASLDLGDLEEELKPKAKLTKEQLEERNTRTCFVGNVDVAVLQKSNYNKFKQHVRSVLKFQGNPIDSIRFRSVAVTNLKVPKKIAIVSKALQPARDTLNAYVLFKTVELAKKFVKKGNASIWMDKHLRVDMASKSDKPDTKKTIFVGNLPYDVKEETLWKLFTDCGEVVDVRVVRDKRTSMGKGIAYVTFKDRAGVTLAMNMNGTKVASELEGEGSRKIRISKAVDTDKAKLQSTQHQAKKVSKRMQKEGSGRSSKFGTKSTEFGGAKATKGEVVFKSKDFKKTKRSSRPPIKKNAVKRVSKKVSKK